LANQRAIKFKPSADWLTIIKTKTFSNFAIKINIKVKRKMLKIIRNVTRNIRKVSTYNIEEVNKFGDMKGDWWDQVRRFEIRNFKSKKWIPSLFAHLDEMIS
jgi:hypothetical protein